MKWEGIQQRKPETIPHRGLSILNCLRPHKLQKAQVTTFILTFKSYDKKQMGSGIVKRCVLAPKSHTGNSSNTSCSISDAVSYSVWESSEWWSKCLDPSPCGRPQNAPGSGLQTGWGLVIALIWRVNQLIKGLSLSPFLCITLSNLKNKITVCTNNSYWKHT